MVGFDSGVETIRELDGKRVAKINSNLTAETDITKALRLNNREEVWAYGSQQKAPFDIDEPLALPMLDQPNPNGLPTSDIVRPSFNATQFLRRTKLSWVIDFGVRKDEARVSLYESAYEYCKNIFSHCVNITAKQFKKSSGGCMPVRLLHIGRSLQHAPSYW
jgi:hypothetical protein